MLSFRTNIAMVLTKDKSRTKKKWTIWNRPHFIKGFPRYIRKRMISLESSSWQNSSSFRVIGRLAVWSSVKTSYTMRLRQAPESFVVAKRYPSLIDRWDLIFSFSLLLRWTFSLLSLSLSFSFPLSFCFSPYCTFVYFN